MVAGQHNLRIESYFSIVRLSIFVPSKAPWVFPLPLPVNREKRPLIPVKDSVRYNTLIH